MRICPFPEISVMVLVDSGKEDLFLTHPRLIWMTRKKRQQKDKAKMPMSLTLAIFLLTPPPTVHK